MKNIEKIRNMSAESYGLMWIDGEELLPGGGGEQE
jgi:hypothetical protein